MALVTSSTVWASRTASVIDYNAPFTLSLWVKRTAAAASASAVACILNSLYQREDLLEMLTSTNVAALAVDAGGFADSAQHTLTLDTWIYLTIVREDVSTLRLYAGAVDTAATLIGTATRNITGRTAATTMTLGARRDDGTNPFVGQLDSAKLWTAGLTLAQVEAERLHEAAQLATGLWAAWALQANGTDASGNSRNLTLAGTPSYASGPAINRGDALPPRSLLVVTPSLPFPYMEV